MVVRLFRPAEDKEACKQALREGASVDECLQRFQVTKNTIYRYLRQIKREQEPVICDESSVVKAKFKPTGDVLITINIIIRGNHGR